VRHHVHIFKNIPAIEQLVEKLVVERLQTFGIDESEAQLYLTLLNYGPETAGDLIDITRIGRSDVHKTLNGLFEKGMIEELTERPPKYRAVPIDAVLDAAIFKQANKLRQMERSKQELVELVSNQVPTSDVTKSF
jgi:sugar-specific transcriptional regulator TrmB